MEQQKLTVPKQNNQLQNTIRKVNSNDMVFFMKNNNQNISSFVMLLTSLSDKTPHVSVMEERPNTTCKDKT